MIRAYSRPQHLWGAVVPCEAIEPAPSVDPAAEGCHNADTRSKFHLYKTARLQAAGEIVGLRFVPASVNHGHEAFFIVTPSGGPGFSVWPHELCDFCL